MLLMQLLVEHNNDVSKKVMHVTLVLAAKRHTKEGSSGLICESDFPNKVLFVKVPEKGQKFQLFNITCASCKVGYIQYYH